MRESSENLSRRASRNEPAKKTSEGSKTKWYLLIILLLILNSSGVGYLIYRQEMFEKNMTRRFGGGTKVNAAESNDAKGESAEAAETPVEEDTPTYESATPETHVVQPGESLTVIAAMYQMDIEQLKQLNGLDSNVISTGQTLIVNPSVQ